MNPTAIAVIAFACVFGGALLGMFLRPRLPEHHLRGESKDVITLGMGLIATMAALVLGLVITTAKGSFEIQNDAVKHSAAKILLLDRVLANYGPETQEVRALLRQTVANRLRAIWPEDHFQRARLDAPDAVLSAHKIEAAILQLSPQNDLQSSLKSKALEVSGAIAETRWLIIGGLGSSVPVPFVAVVVSWLTLIFTSFGIFAPRNATVVMVLFLCALSVAGSIFLILELDQPYEGVIKVSSKPLGYTLSHLGE